MLLFELSLLLVSVVVAVVAVCVFGCVFTHFIVCIFFVCTKFGLHKYCATTQNNNKNHWSKTHACTGIQYVVSVAILAQGSKGFQNALLRGGLPGRSGS